MPKRPDSQAWRYWRTVFGVVAAAAVLVCAHRQRSDSVAPGGINESVLVLLDLPVAYQVSSFNKATCSLIRNGGIRS